MNENYTLHRGDNNTLNTVSDRLFNFNKEQVPLTQLKPFIDLNFTIQNGEDFLAGVCSSVYMWQILYISDFFVEEKYRKQKLGSILLEKVEEEAKKLGATLAHLDTFDFQAKGFYEKHGYEVFGMLDDCPKGHKRFYMKKVL